MGKFIPKTNQELIEKCRQADFRGIFSTEDTQVVWRVTNRIILKIIIHNQLSEGYIEEWYVDHGEEKRFTHWHPASEEIFDDLAIVNTEEFLVLRKSIFGRKVFRGVKEQRHKYRDNFFFRYEIIE